ncbi:hypothetical protein C8A05DRAFT_17024 [Staphylotrichum tortipilum]|uniref:Uncharacterized protein n=1 Tax=Staphylotrichum tortipilum TaxID=2831512 RepID=A0AAN6MI79_9PEZI|nr:hypothetical protein C8A05DRAFT_17024 [Staphylotrichum longicolle]
MDADADTDLPPPLPLQEALELVKLPNAPGAAPGTTAHRYMGTRAAYVPGSDYTGESRRLSLHKAAFGGHVYAQSALAAVRAWREVEAEGREGERLDIHVSTYLPHLTEMRGYLIISSGRLTPTSSSATH